MQSKTWLRPKRSERVRRRFKRDQAYSHPTPAGGIPIVSRCHRKRLAILAGVLILVGGCCLPEAIRSTLQPIETMRFKSSIERRARAEASRVWDNQFAQRYQNHPCADDVRKGFVTGFIETAFGMGGCPPPVPSKPLISKHTLTHTYPGAVPWYEGYKFGNAMAVAGGVDKWRLAPINPDLIACQATRCIDSGATAADTPPIAEPITSLSAEPVIDDSESEEPKRENQLPAPVRDSETPEPSEIEFGLLEDLPQR